MQVCEFSYTNLVIQKLLLIPRTFSCSKYSFLSPQKPKDGYVMLIHIIVNHICNNNFNVIFPSTAQFNMLPLYMKFLTHDLPGVWYLLQHLFSAKKILPLCTVISYDSYTDTYYDNEHLILTYCIVFEIHSTCYVHFYLKQCKFWDCKLYCHISNPFALEFSVQCTLQKTGI